MESRRKAAFHIFSAIEYQLIFLQTSWFVD